MTVITLAYVLPSIYNTLFDTRINKPFITYSQTKKDYFTYRNVDGKPKYFDRKNKEYNQYEYLDATPIMNFHYHLGKGTLPDSFAGVKLIPQQLRMESTFQFFEPQQLFAPAYGLYPLFESRPEFGLAYPKDMFRINRRIEFIDAKSNTINEEKSRKYLEALIKEGFHFPARIVSGLPTLMKSKDEGWFLTDNQEQLFHLMMVKGEPYVKHIPLPAGVKLKIIECNDFDSGEYFAILISTGNGIYTLNKRDYSTTRFPIDDYVPENQTMNIMGTLFDKTVTLYREDGVKLYTVDRSYKLVDQHEELVPLKSTMTIGKVYSFLFPFQLSLDSPYNSFIRFTPVKAATWSWIILNIVLLGITVWLIRKEGKSLKKSIIDLLVVAFTGIFGFLAVHIIPNKQY